MWPVGIKSILQWVRARITFQNFQSSLIPWTRTFQLRCFSNCSNMRIFSLHQIYPSDLWGRFYTSYSFSVSRRFFRCYIHKGKTVVCWSCQSSQCGWRYLWLFAGHTEEDLFWSHPGSEKIYWKEDLANATMQSSFSYIIKACPVRTMSLLLLSTSPLL